jgi:exodeoxyribonuclease VII small subunit
MKVKDQISFEQALEGLEKSAQALQKEGTTLDEAMASYEDGIKYYERCTELLNVAKQKLQIYDKATGELSDF